MPQRVLITGASGFVGGWLARECEESGAEVLGVSRSGASPAGTGLAVDLLDSAAVAGAVEEFRPQAIHHLAALASTGRSWQDPVRCVSDNQAMTWNLLEAVRLHSPDATVLLACSGESYGVPRSLPVTEGHPIAPGTPYAVAKTVTDLIGGLYADGHGLRVIRARAFNHAGPGQGGSFLLGSICAQLATAPGDGPATVRTGSATIARDYCDVRDVARAYRLLVEAGEPGVFNVCSGNATTTAEVVALLGEAAAPREVRHEVDPALVRPHETEAICGDPSKIARVTGWAPTIPLARTVADALEAAAAAA